ncbi:cytochrome c [Nitrosomonas sp. HPC101]|uniref:c-type cytochrome n=1 Tax=Nitrosomonas sp. HPC101 TaxID=1658667 RepID=UPI00136EA24F|nr:cytochrome c [Nitrosomonas sp. HPC101]MXS85951.1 cytochrome c [Nitrosomonas sp. HPC101]
MILSFSGVADATGNTDSVKSKIAMCQGCHGIEGYRTAYPFVYHVPKLGGQHLPYLVKALKDYRSGERNHPTMVGIAGTLSDEDIDALAAYYADN